MVVDSAHNDCFDAYYAKPPSATPSITQTSNSLLNSYFDGSASWFTCVSSSVQRVKLTSRQSHGHASEPLTLAAAEAAGRYGHVLFPSGANEPALNLAEKLLQTVGKDWAARVFYSDNGSTGMEVALKMALRAAGRRYGWKGIDGSEVGVIGLRGGYHGDTVSPASGVSRSLLKKQIGSMDATEASTFNTVVDWYKGRGHWFSPPMVQYIDGQPTVLSTPPDEWPALPSSLTSSSSTDISWSIPYDSISAVYDVESRSNSPLAEYYRSHIRSTLERLVGEGRRFGALVMEPVCLGAGGMVFVDPLFQKILIEVVRSSSDLFGPSSGDETSAVGERLTSASSSDGWQGLPVIYDEGESVITYVCSLADFSLLRIESIRLPLGSFCSWPHARYRRLRKNSHWRSLTPVHYARFAKHLCQLPVGPKGRCAVARAQLYCQPDRMFGRVEGYRDDGEQDMGRREGIMEWFR